MAAELKRYWKAVWYCAGNGEDRQLLEDLTGGHMRGRTGGQS
jgi:hypothetical protein